MPLPKWSAKYSARLLQHTTWRLRTLETAADSSVLNPVMHSPPRMHHAVAATASNKQKKADHTTRLSTHLSMVSSTPKQ